MNYKSCEPLGSELLNEAGGRFRKEKTQLTDFSDYTPKTTVRELAESE